MPLLSLVTSNINFTDLFLALDGGEYATLQIAKEAGAATLNYGLFISGVLNFFIMAFIVFILVKWINKLRGPEPVKEPTTKKCPYCLSEIAIKATKCSFCTSDVE